ncbi:hypothetical protein [Lentzea aerocolonigenes]|uniref:hypothetical protein n=1 Tax=Lentzea aerocolonigenes TaxID=68170 RepID=UPI000AFCD7E4|nr:hypothetical protein [Lentzea aerocolonigenes]
MAVPDPRPAPRRPGILQATNHLVEGDLDRAADIGFRAGAREPSAPIAAPVWRLP